MSRPSGTVHLFRLFGVDVYLHYLWFVAVAYWITQPAGYSSIIWNIGDCMGVFAIVLLHEFGHALATRSVGGQADQIILWLLGGATPVRPPNRPGALFWSIAAGPLVNVLLIPILTGGWLLARASDWQFTAPETYRLLSHLQFLNITLLILNILPIYPLDGGQILRALLWFMFGPAKSLMIASVAGFIGIGLLVIGMAFLVLKFPDTISALWAGLTVFFIVSNCWRGLLQARDLARIAKLPRRQGFACPACKTAPPEGEYWRCAKCGKPFDTFQTLATCPHCGVQYNATQCLDCGIARPIGEWITSPANTTGL
jgi:Zn-dependent protease